MRTPPVIPRASLFHEGLRPMLMWLLQVRNWRSPRVEPKRSIAAEGGLEVSYPQHPQPDPPPRDPSERPPLWEGGPHSDTELDLIAAGGRIEDEMKVIPPM